MQPILWIPSIAAALYVLHRIALWMERRGWIFYRDTRASSSAMSNAFMQVQALLEPQAAFVVEKRSFEEVEEVDAGGPPTAG